MNNAIKSLEFVDVLFDKDVHFLLHGRLKKK